MLLPFLNASMHTDADQSAMKNNLMTTLNETTACIC